MKLLVKVDKKVILFLLLLPIIIDLIIPPFRNCDLIQLFWTLLLFFWYLGAGTILSEKDFRSNPILVNIFKISLYLLIIYAIIQELIIIDLDTFFSNSNIIIHFSGLVLYLWVIYYITVKLLRIEDRIGKKHDGIITFLLIFLLPVGIWWIQPRLQLIMETSIPTNLDLLNSKDDNSR